MILSTRIAIIVSLNDRGNAGGAVRGEGEDEQGFGRTVFVRRGARGADGILRQKFGAIAGAGQHRHHRKVEYGAARPDPSPRSRKGGCRTASTGASASSRKGEYRAPRTRS